MLNQLLYLLLFETASPSYNAFTSVLPTRIVVNEQAVMSNTNKAEIPIKQGNSIAPVIEAKSVYAVDLATETPLFVKDIFTRRPIASIAKLVTAMIILDNHSPDEILTVSKNAAGQEGSKMWLFAGEKITVENALTGMLVNSGNDAAVAFAEFDAGTEEAFVDKMNKKAASLGLKNTHFSNAKGFDEHENYSNAFDAYIFSRAALNYPLIKKIAAIKIGEVSSFNGKTKHKLESTNELLENPYYKVTGLKTGHTPAAGQSFVGLVQAPNGHEILTIVLDSPNRFKETKILIDWMLRNYLFP